jgi:hypothetical protein
VAASVVAVGFKTVDAAWNAAPEGWTAEIWVGLVGGEGTVATVNGGVGAATGDAEDS